MPGYVVGTVKCLVHVHWLPNPGGLAAYKTDDSVPLVLPIVTPVTPSIVQDNNAVIVVNVTDNVTSVVGSLLARYL